MFFVLLVSFFSKREIIKRSKHTGSIGWSHNQLGHSFTSLPKSDLKFLLLVVEKKKILISSLDMDNHTTTTPR